MTNLTSNDELDMSDSSSSATRYMLVNNQDYSHFHEKLKKKPLDIQKFKGQSSNIKIENWFKLCERIVKYMEWTEEESILYLSTYLEDDALEWYSSNLDRYNTFNDAKEDLLAQFGIDTTDHKTGIKPYFDNIKRYTGLAGLDLKNTLSILKQNLPSSIKDFIGGTFINSYSQFYNIVQEAEEHIERKRKEFEKRRALRSTPFRPNHTNSKIGAAPPPVRKPKDKRPTVPPRPYKICADLGFHGRYHWMSDCRNKTSSTTKPKEVNCSEIENDINKIDLN